MAAYIYNDGDRTVANIAARNALPKFDGMKVTVTDAIGDVLTGGGIATYQWSDGANRWLLLWRETKDNVNFTREDIVIANSKAVLSYLPSSSVSLGGILILDMSGVEPVVIAEIAQPNIVGNEVLLGTDIYDGKTLIITYAYGAIEAAVHELISSNIGW
jgi:hypothetical protein